MADDVVAELEAELALYPLNGTAQRAHDEIVALRQRDLDQQEALKAAISVYRSTIRDAALEEAARLCERVPGDPQYGVFFAKAIRALKDTRRD